MISRIDLITDAQRFDIAEFMYSIDAQSLIKTDVIKVINVLNQLKIITEDQKQDYSRRVLDYCPSVLLTVHSLVLEYIDKPVLDEIMKNYYYGV
jgi:hypothetical protein